MSSGVIFIETDSIRAMYIFYTHWTFPLPGSEFNSNVFRQIRIQFSFLYCSLTFAHPRCHSFCLTWLLFAPLSLFPLKSMIFKNGTRPGCEPVTLLFKVQQLNQWAKPPICLLREMKAVRILMSNWFCALIEIAKPRIEVIVTFLIKTLKGDYAEENWPIDLIFCMVTYLDLVYYAVKSQEIFRSQTTPTGLPAY